MIQTPPLVSRIPVFGAIRPPAVQQALRYVLARDINPFASLLDLGQMFHLDRGMADNFQEAFVIPNIIFARGMILQWPLRLHSCFF